MKALLLTVLMMVSAIGVSYGDDSKEKTQTNESVRIMEIR